MIFQKNCMVILLVTLITLSSSLSNAYDGEVHKIINEKAAEQTQILRNVLINQLGMQPDPNKPDNFDSRTPLMYAVEKENVKIIEMLLEKGADPDKVDINENKTPLTYAKEKGNVEIINILLRVNSAKKVRENNLSFEFFINYVKMCYMKLSGFFKGPKEI